MLFSQPCAGCWVAGLKNLQLLLARADNAASHHPFGALERIPHPISSSQLGLG